MFGVALAAVQAEIDHAGGPVLVDHLAHERRAHMARAEIATRLPMVHHGTEFVATHQPSARTRPDTIVGEELRHPARFAAVDEMAIAHHESLALVLDTLRER